MVYCKREIVGFDKYPHVSPHLYQCINLYQLIVKSWNDLRSFEKNKISEVDFRKKKLKYCQLRVQLDRIVCRIYFYLD